MPPTSWFADYVSMLHDPAHWLFEITVSIVFDLMIVYVGYQLLVKRVIIPRLRREIHEEIDREHDLEHPLPAQREHPDKIVLNAELGQPKLTVQHIQRGCDCRFLRGSHDEGCSYNLPTSTS